MVFSFFKKQQEKMIARPAAVPRPAEARTDSTSPDGKEKEAVPGQSKAEGKESGGAAQQVEPSDFSDFVFSQSSLDFQVEVDVDPIDAQAEEAAVLFANSQDAAAQSVLENAARTFCHGTGERLWLMLFDLYRLSGQQAAFEALGIEYAQAFEKSPPVWSGHAVVEKPKTRESAPGSLVFKGELLGSNEAAFEAIRKSLEKNRKLRLDMSKVRQLDHEGCGCFLQLLALARKNKQDIELLGREALGELLQAQVETGRPDGKACWLLLLELCQLQGRQEAFEEIAIDYAVTFEESPPSWESKRVAAPEPIAAEEVLASEGSGDVYPLSGEVKSSRFADLSDFAENHDVLQIDCSGLKRIDFISAGALLNALTSVRRSGKLVVFRHPNYLVAELLRIVGLTAVATIVFAKR